ncbi:hypothetical protein FOA52_000250 [Chlamydomonas sp. UWO 241]|nr:hypothetical protein FOA52_000250 [Chlamydomonas sp. UWO 241]
MAFVCATMQDWRPAALLLLLLLLLQLFLAHRSTSPCLPPTPCAPCAPEDVDADPLFIADDLMIAADLIVVVSRRGTKEEVVAVNGPATWAVNGRTSDNDEKGQQLGLSAFFANVQSAQQYRCQDADVSTFNIRAQPDPRVQ